MYSGCGAIGNYVEKKTKHCFRHGLETSMRVVTGKGVAAAAFSGQTPGLGGGKIGADGLVPG